MNKQDEIKNILVFKMLEMDLENALKNFLEIATDINTVKKGADYLILLGNRLNDIIKEKK